VYKKKLDTLISQIYYWNKTLHVSDSSFVHHLDFSLYTQQWYMLYRFAEGMQAGSGWQCHGQRNYPKHVEIHSKDKSEKLVHLVGFITRNLS
jgi:hypothetical protein